ncbi:hypothetical protein [Maribacter litoralis]|uniref:hypothetical protein n=1 Tax=Maribacter litoralis TaxID=2059726 RepID=UPI003F5CC58A
MNITTFQEYKDNFNRELELVENKQNLIKNEIQEIEVFINNDSIVSNEYDYLRNQFIESRTDKNVFKLILPKNSKEDFNTAYKEFKINGSVDIFKFANELEDIFKERKLVYKQAEELAKYSDWLLTSFDNKSPKSKRINTSLNLEQKLLALQYLGLNLQGVDNTKASKILSAILGMGYDNIKKSHPQIYFNFIDNQVRTKDNFEKLLKLFENEQFEEIHNKISEDLDSLH